MTIQTTPYEVKQYTYQVVLIDMQGTIFESCDSIFNAEKFIGKSIKNLCYFFEGELETILHNTAPKKTFEKVKIESDSLPGYYDFIFSKQELDGQQFVLWEIYDYTTIYQEYIFIQQLKNEIAILEQLRKKDLGSAKDNIEFFQSGYTSSDNNVNKLITKTIESKFKDLYSQFKEKKSNNDDSLERLKNCIDKLGFEIDDFVEQLKSAQIKQVNIRALIRSSLNSSSINFEVGVPDEVSINVNLVKKLLNIFSLQHAPTPSSYIRNASVSINQSLSNRSSVIIIVREDAKYALNNVCAYINLSLLKSLIVMIGGDLTVNFKELESVYLTKIELPIK